MTLFDWTGQNLRMEDEGQLPRRHYHPVITARVASHTTISIRLLL